MLHEMEVHHPLAWVEMTENLRQCLPVMIIGIQYDDEHRMYWIEIDAELELLASSRNVEREDGVSWVMKMAGG